MTAIEKNPARLARVGRSERGESSSSKFILNPRLPEALQEFAPKKVWVGMEISHEENGKISKRPVNPHLNELAKSNDNSTWGTFDEANIALSTYQFDRWATYRPQYLAIALSPSLNLICVDLDNVIDKETGEVNQEALKIVERLNSYTEISTSGTGLHIYLKAQKKTAKTNRSLFSSKGSKIEIFDNRFILITNQTWGERKPLREAQEDLDAICHEYFKEAEEAPLDESSHTSPEMTDEEVIEKASKANRVGEKFKRLFEEGDTSEYAGDDSAADFALLCLLAYWTQNPDQIERIFSRSILGQREKWTKRSDYRKRSIKEALKKVKKTYQASKRKEQPVPDHAILVEPGNIHLAVDAAEEILIKHDCGIFQRHGRLVRIVKVGSLATPKSSSIRRPDNAMVVVEVDPIYLTEVLTKLGCWARFDIRTNGPKAIDCPERIAKHLLARRQWKIPHLTGIIYAPTLRADGSILQTPGYDPMSGLFYDPGSYAFEQIPEGPTQEEAKKALNVFLKLIEYFPFEDNASRSVSLSSFLTGLIRKSLRTAPFHGFTAPKMGSGKTLLASLVAYIVTGNELVVLPPADDEKEEKKRILSVLMDGDPIVCYDNIERPFGSAALCAVLTQEQYKDRLLGETTSITVSTNSTFLGTGNNLRFIGDLSTRALLCKLDPNCERPEEREFPFDIRAYVHQNRPSLVCAGLTILRAYHVAGRPNLGIKPFGRFEDWSNFVRMALVWLGEEDPCATRKEIEAEDPVRTSLSNLLNAWYESVGDLRFPIKKLIEKGYQNAENGDALLKEALEEMAPDGRGGINSKSLGKKLSSFKGRIENGFRIEKAGIYQGIDTWRVVKVSQ